MKRLCFGGSFNPIHHGHLICARAIAEAAGFERVVLIPTAQPPHKPSSPQLAPAADRLAMCRLAAAEQPELFEADDVELTRAGPSYTIDTVVALRSRGWDPIHWLIGADMLLYLPKWYRAAELLRQVQFVVMARPGVELDWQRLPAEFRGLPKNVVTAPLIDISATEIRARVAGGRSIACLTPRPVADYISAHALYR